MIRLWNDLFGVFVPLSRGGFWLILFNAFPSLSFWNVFPMVAPEMLYKMILSRKSTVRSSPVSVTARRIAVVNDCSFRVMDTSNMA